MTRDEMREALARGYCTERNKHKVLDPDLIEDMISELALLPQETMSEEEISKIIQVCEFCSKPKPPQRIEPFDFPPTTSFISMNDKIDALAGKINELIAKWNEKEV